MKNRKYKELWDRPGYLIRRLHQIHLGIFAEECSNEDITPVQFGVLTVLQNGKELDQLTLSTSVGIDRTSGADVFRRLERRKLLTRRPSEFDGRAKLVKITERGREFVTRIRPTVVRAQDRLVSPLSEEELEEFYRLAHKMIEANHTASRAPAGFARRPDTRQVVAPD